MRKNLKIGGTYMFTFIKALFKGMILGFKWYGRRVSESKWYIIPLVFDTVLYPIKLIVFSLMCLTKGGRKVVYQIGMVAFEDLED